MESRRLVRATAIAIGALFLIAILATVAVLLAGPRGPLLGFSQVAGGFLVIALWLVFLLALMIGVVAAYLAWVSRQHPAWAAAGPLAALRCRYALGQISRDEFERLRADLEGRPERAHPAP